MPYLSGITIYPVKSLDGFGLAEATVLPSGALMHDRRWRLIDTEGRVVNAKRTSRFHSIRARFEGMDDESNRISQPSSGHFVTLWMGHDLDQMSDDSQSAETFPLIPGSEGPCEWLSDALQEHVFLEERVEGGFPDDRDAAGPTVISTETLGEVARWFGWNDAEARRRFRMNLELTAEPDQLSSGKSQDSKVLYNPFWEDSLACPVQKMNSISSLSEGDDSLDYLPVGEPDVFSIGRIYFRPTGACRRCVVPSRDTRTGKQIKLFRDVFEARRYHGLRQDVDTRDWQDYYRLGLNTSVLRSPTGGQITIGDELKLLQTS
jgi:uncharacterized protein YcbX